MTKARAGRAWEIDGVRGAAVILMSLFHAVFDLAVYYQININYLSGFWFYVGRASAVLFIFISGISSGFSKNIIKRGITVLCCAMLITVASIPIMGENYIRFGILHFFGTVMILKGVLDIFVKDGRKTNIIACVAIPVSYGLGVFFENMTTTVSFLFPIGIVTENFNSYDYYPIFPWLSIFAAGVLASGTIYKSRASLLVYSPFDTDVLMGKALRLVCFLGRHSLVIYLVHQPLIMAALYLIFNVI